MTDPTRCPVQADAARGRDRGSASVWILALGVAVIAVAGFSASVGAAIVARHQAQAVADLGALAAAAHAVEGGETACAHAARVITANRARLVACHVAGLDAVITVRVRAAGLASALPPAEAKSRAGPVESPDGCLVERVAVQGWLGRPEPALD